MNFLESTPVNLRNHFAPFGERDEIDALQWVLLLIRLHLNIFAYLLIEAAGES